ncbi:oligopeptide/dipeptide ABC transporter ATP-binding protein [Elusimicrobium posterum]|uniref:ABC transporter ATP-binding protein n=1 Tax=Elusimicrobium posterum TaxID=3116653 RepID=UPI003C73B156
MLKPPILTIKDLSVTFRTHGKDLKVLKGLSYALKKGGTLCVVGESGCGKTVHSLAIMRLLDSNAKISGSVEFAGTNLLKLSEEEMRKVRGARIAMIFQDPMSSLNPVLTIGAQIIETLLAHGVSDKKEAARTAAELLGKVGIADGAQKLNLYPHEFSGGQRQRIMIAIALACKPDILIADEPTTALDVTIQKQIITLLKDLQAQEGMSLVFITHNLGLVSQMGGDVLVLYAGQLAEYNNTKHIFDKPLHPYTRGLLASARGLEEGAQVLNAIDGNPPPAGKYFDGCPFEPRCKEKLEKCKHKNPPAFGRSAKVRCWLLENTKHDVAGVEPEK